MPGCSESLEPGAPCAAGTLAPPGSPGLGRAAGSRTHEVRARVSAAALPFRWAPRHPRTAPRGAEGGAAGSQGGAPGGPSQSGGGRRPWRAGDVQRDSGQAAAAGQWLDLWLPHPVARAPLPGSVGVVPGPGRGAPVQLSREARAQMSGAIPRPWHVTRACSRRRCPVGPLRARPTPSALVLK